MGVVAWDRIRIKGDGERGAVALVDITKSMVQQSQIGLPRVVAQELNVVEGESVTVHPNPPPISVKYVHEKMRGKKLGREELYSIVRDVVDKNLSEVEMAAFVMAEQYHGMDDNELLWLTHDS